jgi:hypothetical protein
MSTKPHSHYCPDLALFLAQQEYVNFFIFHLSLVLDDLIISSNHHYSITPDNPFNCLLMTGWIDPPSPITVQIWHHFLPIRKQRTLFHVMLSTFDRNDPDGGKIRLTLYDTPIAGVKISEPFFLGKKINIRRVRTEQTTNHRLENPTPGMSQTI